MDTNCKKSLLLSPKERAVELLKKFSSCAGTYLNETVFGIARRSAILCCDEILRGLSIGEFPTTSADVYNYWKTVKEEIQKL